MNQKALNFTDCVPRLRILTDLLLPYACSTKRGAKHFLGVVNLTHPMYNRVNMGYNTKYYKKPKPLSHISPKPLKHTIF